MSSIPKKSKHKLKVIQKTKRIMNNYTVTLIYSDSSLNHSRVYYKGDKATLSQALSYHLDNLRVNWDIVCGVFCRDQKGEHYAQYVNIRAVDECVSETMSDLTQAVCKYLFDRANKLHKLCPWFIAVPRSNDETIDLNLIIKTAHEYKVFNLIGTNFEIDCNLPVVDYHTGKQWYDIASDFTWEEVELDFNDINIENKQKENL